MTTVLSDGPFKIEWYWGGAEATVYGDSVDRTGEYFRDMYENM